MTTTINKAYINALLADAAYIDGLTNGMTGDALKIANKSALITRMTQQQADFIATNFTVISAEDKPDWPLGSSFEGVVWKGNAGTAYAEQTYVSIRGSQQITDFVAADANLAVSGMARSQLIDMVNWWLRITTPTTSKARQIENTHDAVTDAEGFRVYTSSLNGEGLVASGAHLNIDGHSLGGQLATAFARIFGKTWPVDDLVLLIDAITFSVQRIKGCFVSYSEQASNEEMYEELTWAA